MTWVDEKAKYEAIAAQIEPAAVVMTKDHWLWSAAWYFLAVITLGLIMLGMGKTKFLTRYATTLGPWHGYPRDWPALSKRLLTHECRHTTQFVFAGWFVPVLGWFFGRKVRAVVGLLPMAIAYGLVVLPIGLAVGRWQLELDADRTAWRWAIRNGYTPKQIRDRADQFGRKVCGAPYLFAWPNNLGGVKAFTKAAEKVIRDHG